MVSQVFSLLTTAFSACIGFFVDIVDSVGGGAYILAGFCIALVVGLLFIPLRGRNALSAIGDYKAQKIHNKKGD